MSDGERVDKSQYKEVVKGEKRVLLIQVIVMTILAAIIAVIFLSIMLAKPVTDYGSTHFITNTTNAL